MHKTRRTFAIVSSGVLMLALTAGAFGLAGVHAAGIGGAKLPLIHAAIGTATPTPAPTLTPTFTPQANAGPAAAIELMPDPDEIVCDGVQGSRLTIHVRDALGASVNNGTPVYFSVIGRPGVADPSVATIQNGVVTTKVYGFLLPQNPFQPLSVEVDVGRIEATIRVLCLPPTQCVPGVPCTPCDPVSPPQPFSPPCGPPSPPQCDPVSPPQPFSPPCQVPPPPSPPTCWPVSPPLGLPPCSTPTPPPGCSPFDPSSPPCATATPLPGCSPFVPASPPCVPSTPGPCIPGIPPCGPDSGYTIALDCDTAADGVQASCDVPLGTTSLDVGVVLRNAGPRTDVPAAFNFIVHDPDMSRLNPPPGIDANFNANPDFNEAGLGTSWDCALSAPSANTGADGPGKATSSLSCFDPGGPAPAVAPGSDRLLATVHYNVPLSAAAGSVPLSLSDVAFANYLTEELLLCDASGPPPSQCTGATVNLGTGSSGGPAHRTATPTPAATAIPTATATLTPPPCADVTRDGRVTLDDVLAMAMRLRQRHPSLRYDVNHDGKVDTADLLMVIGQLGRRCGPAHPHHD